MPPKSLSQGRAGLQDYFHNLDIQNQPADHGGYRAVRRGVIHDYASFYFGPRSPMLLQLHTGRVAGYNETQDATRLSWVSDAPKRFCAERRPFRIL